MADQNTQQTTQSGNSTLAFIVGALVVAVGVMGYVLWSGQGGEEGLTISIEGADTAIEDAAEAVSGS